MHKHADGIGALCLYSVVCPIGPRRIPYGGVEVDYSDATGSSWVQWTPLDDFHNDWAMVRSGVDVCMTHVDLYMGDPSWGLTGVDGSGITSRGITN